MFGFLIKKAFFDFWDNMLTIFLLNIGFILFAGLIFGTSYLLSFSVILNILGLLVTGFIFYTYTGAVSLLTSEIADFKSVSFKMFFGFIKESIKPAILIAAISILQVIILMVSVPFYAKQGLIGIFAIATIFWINVIWVLASQFYYPIYSRLDKNLKKVLRKSLMVFFDNTLYSIMLFFITILLSFLSLFTAFLFPGMTAVLLWYQVAFKLRLYKYDYLEENPEANRKKIPWASLFLEDKEKLGPRSLKSTIFPWKY